MSVVFASPCCSLESAMAYELLAFLLKLERVLLRRGEKKSVLNCQVMNLFRIWSLWYS
jgi:hypothetical protein